jgi:hypothetical protein
MNLAVIIGRLSPTHGIQVLNLQNPYRQARTLDPEP